MSGNAFWKAFGCTNLIFFANIIAMLVRVSIPHHMDVFLFYVPLAELVVLLGVAIWGIKNSVDAALGITLGIVLQGVLWLCFILFLGLQSALGDSSANDDYFSKP